MIKKLSEFTYEEIDFICSKFKSCNECPFNSIRDLYCFAFDFYRDLFGNLTVDLGDIYDN